MNIEDTERMLEDCYEIAMAKASGKQAPDSAISGNIKKWLDIVMDRSEKSKGVFTVLFTSVVYKLITPEQDIRIHQSDMPGGSGYSGRTFDTKYITPFLKQHKFPSMAESGWLTRSLEQKSPYTLDYKGAITPKNLKTAFLSLLDSIQQGTDCNAILDYMLQCLVIQRNKHQLLMARPQHLRIPQIVDLLDKHFHYRYYASGAARLPVLALYALYQAIMGTGRYADKRLLPLESHTTADLRSGRLGDICIECIDGSPFEAIEVKFDIPITHHIVERAIEKVQSSTLDTYYILSTVPAKDDDMKQIEDDCNGLYAVHGCQIIVNGVLPTIKYLLRTVDEPRRFIAYYAQLLEQDDSIKYEHKLAWNQLVIQLQS